MGFCFSAAWASLGGAASFRAIGVIQRLPTSLHAPLKTAHRLAGGVAWALAAATAVVGSDHPVFSTGGTAEEVVEFVTM